MEHFWLMLCQNTKCIALLFAKKTSTFVTLKFLFEMEHFWLMLCQNVKCIALLFLPQNLASCILKMNIGFFIDFMPTQWTYNFAFSFKITRRYHLWIFYFKSKYKMFDWFYATIPSLQQCSFVHNHPFYYSSISMYNQNNKFLIDFKPKYQVYRLSFCLKISHFYYSMQNQNIQFLINFIPKYQEARLYT